MNPDEIPIGKAEDLRVFKFGQLTPLYRIANKNGKTQWRCKCDCGNLHDVCATDLKQGHIKSCGCFIKTHPAHNAVDLTNQVFGKLTVLYRYKNGNKNSHVLWHCKCECGNECNVSATNLRTGRTTSCGCWKKEKASLDHLKDLTGQKFNKLTVLYRVDDSLTGRVKWHCKCDCGNECNVLSHNLLDGHTTSCGCFRSQGEKLIRELLDKANIPYQYEYSFSDCRFPDTNYYARFDFYVNNLYLIEYDGEQHYYSTSGWNTEESVQNLQKRDAFKNQWCKNNNIPLIRIPYTHLKDLCIEDLQLETSKFIVN